MEEKKITAKEFDAAVIKVMEEIVDDPNNDIKTVMIMPLIGMSYANKMRAVLFGESEEE